MTTTEIPAELEFTLGDRLRKAREYAHLKQEEMAEILGVSNGTISNWETGRGYPRGDSLKVIRRWAEETCTPYEWLLGVRIGCLPSPANALNRAIERLQPTEDPDFVYTGRTNELVAV